MTPVARARELLPTHTTPELRYVLASLLMAEFGITRNAARRYVNYAMRPLSGNRGGARPGAGRKPNKQGE